MRRERACRSSATRRCPVHLLASAIDGCARYSYAFQRINQSIDWQAMTQVTTASGSIPAHELGPTLMHEHLFVNLVPEYRGTGLLNNEELLLEELAMFTSAGGRTIVELTPAELTVGAAPDPTGALTGAEHSDYGWASRTPSSVEALRRVAAQARINLIVGTGHYRDPYLSSGWLDAHSADDIANVLVADIEDGISGTDIRAGIIGEIGADKWFISAREERSFRAAARAQKRTDVALSTHAARWPVGIAQLDLLQEEGVDLRRVIIGHCDTVPILDYHSALAQRGAFVQFDTIRGESEQHIAQGVRLVTEMIDAGFESQLLLSQDVCTSTQLRSAGGCGYAFVLTHFVHRLRESGLSEDSIQAMTQENPRRALTGA